MKCDVGYVIHDNCVVVVVGGSKSGNASATAVIG